MNDLKNKTVIITGASSGIGAQLVKSFALHKCNIILLSRNLEKMNNLISNISLEDNQNLADMNQDGTINILDVIDVVSGILGTTFRESVEWLEENFPQLEVERRLQELDKSIHWKKK